MENKVMLYDVVHQLCDKKGITVRKLEILLGIGNGVIAGWNRVNPRIDLLSRVANYFNVSLDWLAGNYANAVKIPILGSVVAGVPVGVETDILGWEEIPSSLGSITDYFAMRINGASMSPVLVEGDVIICRKQSVIDSNEIAIVTIQNENATVKKVKLLDNGIMLIGFNDAVYSPTFYSTQEIMTLPVQIVGKVVECRRRF